MNPVPILVIVLKQYQKYSTLGLVSRAESEHDKVEINSFN